MEQALYWLVGVIGVPVVERLKAAWGLEGKAALWLTVAVAAGLGVAALFVSQQAALSDFTWDNLAAAFGQVLAAATLAYKLLLSE